MNNLSRNLLGNLRYWKFKKDLLWFGDKCYHMVNHSFNHACDIWDFVNQIFPPLLQHRRRFLFAEDLYSFYMAIWFHDIGHKGNERYGEPHKIRENHGLISAEIILRSPENFKIYEIDDYYIGLKFPLGNLKKTLPQIIMEREQSKLTICEKIALLSMYHQSNTPITRVEANSLFGRDRIISEDYFQNSDINKGEVITLQDIAEKRLDRNEAQKFISMAALFRLIDSFDISKNRVGDPTEGKIKKLVIDMDKSYLTEQIEREAKIAARRLSKGDHVKEMFIYKILFTDVIKSFEKNEEVDIAMIKKTIGDKAELHDYLSFLSFAYFIACSPGHFDLHSSVDKIEPKLTRCRGGWRLVLNIYSNREIKKLKKMVVKELGKKTQSVLERLIGEENEEIDPYGERSYFFKEINSVAEHLKIIFSPRFSFQLILYPFSGNPVRKRRKDFV